MARQIVSVRISDADLAKLVPALARFSDKMKKKIASQAMYAGAEVHLEAARQLVPKKSRELMKSLARRKRNYRDTVGTIVLARRSSQYPGGYYSHLVEKGHKLYRTKKKGGPKVFIKHVAAQPYMRPAMEQNKAAIIERIKERAAADIKKEVVGR